jgi:diguanylate cyclase (GGDEF)-like protein
VVTDAVAPPLGDASPVPDGVGAERAALGQAVQARADDVGRLIDARFETDLRGQAYATARLATHLIGRWLATDEVASADDEAVLAQQGEQAILENAELASVAKAYLAWRDATTAVIAEEAVRLGVSQEVVDLASDVVRLSCDGSLVRIVRQFDATRRSLQQRLNEKQQSLAHQALHDQLTGLANRTLLADRLDRASGALDRTGRGAVLLFLDLDNFKAVNDRFGHAAGDCLLMAVADRLQDLVRAGDTVARLGGDEFVVLAEDLDEPTVAARALAERIHMAMGAPVQVGERQLHTSVSIGIAEVLPGADPELSLSRADAAMYRAKRGGPARFEYYNAAIGEDNRRQSQLVHDLRVAHREGQFDIHYQPLFTLAGEVVGMEALLRWQHPEVGAIAPDEFIPLLERSREIVPVGRWVLEQATRQCRVWRDEGRPGITVSVNISARQLHHPAFVGEVREVLDGARLDPGALILEVTESVLVMDSARVGPVMQAIRDLGVHMALDDFGTGYSSLLYLKGLPIDRLKVDRSFVAGLGSTGHDATIVATVVDLAHKLGLRVVAEGVETEEELAAVEAVGCDEAQGFLLARPAPAASFTSDRTPAGT